MESCSKHYGVMVQYRSVLVDIIHSGYGLLLVIGIRINLSYLLDVTEAQALGYKNSYIQVYSNSWGPPDNGFLVQGPGYYSGRILKQGVSQVCVYIIHVFVYMEVLLGYPVF